MVAGVIAAGDHPDSSVLAVNGPMGVGTDAPSATATGPSAMGSGGKLKNTAAGGAVSESGGITNASPPSCALNPSCLAISAAPSNDRQMFGAALWLMAPDGLMRARCTLRSLPYAGRGTFVHGTHRAAFRQCAGAVVGS
jgi:hypothetical protein